MNEKETEQQKDTKQKKQSSKLSILNNLPYFQMWELQPFYNVRKKILKKGKLQLYDLINPDPTLEP